MKFNRVFAMPSAWTFKIKPIRELLQRYVGTGSGWAEFTNDINPDRKAKFHMDAEQFCKTIPGTFTGVLFDPPYSYRQEAAGRKVTRLDTSSNFYNRVMNAICDKIDGGGLLFHLVGIVNRGFELVEVLLVAHGAHHNDTICVVERKVGNKNGT